MKLSVLAFLLLCSAGCAMLEAAPDLTCAVIHKPKRGECPKGYVKEAKPRFTERNGSKEFACVSDDPKKGPCTDELRPGESEGIMFHLQPEPPPTNDRPKT